MTIAQAPATARSATPAPNTISTRASDLDYIRRQQLKTIQVPMLEGKLDLPLVAEFIRKVELMATNLGMAPHDTTDHMLHPSYDSPRAITRQSHPEQ